jgi:drug/metabolite transporter (DMT)-like permease
LSERLSWRVYAALLGTQVFFASLSVVGKSVLTEWAWQAFITVRIVGSAILFFALYLLTGAEKIERKHFPKLALFGFLGVTANQFQFAAGLSRTKATHATVLVTSIPVFTAILASLLGREKLVRQKIFGILLSMSGAVSLVLLAALSRGKDISLGPGQALGNLLILSNSLVYSLFLVLSKDLLHRYKAITVSAWMFIFGSLFGLLFDGALALAYPEEASAVVAQITGSSPATVLRMGYVILFATGLGYGLNAWSLRHAPTSLVASYTYLQPVVAATLAWVFLGEALHWQEFVAAGLIFVGVWMVARAPQTRSTPAEEGKAHSSEKPAQH